MLLQVLEAVSGDGGLNGGYKFAIFLQRRKSKQIYQGFDLSQAWNGSRIEFRAFKKAHIVEIRLAL